MNMTHPDILYMERTGGYDGAEDEADTPLGVCPVCGRTVYAEYKYLQADGDDTYFCDEKCALRYYGVSIYD